MLLLLAALVVAACGALALYAHRCMTYWERRGVPQLPSAHFPFGHLWPTMLFQRSFGEVCSDLYWPVPASVPLAGAYFLYKPAVVVRDPELVKKMLVKDFHHFHDRGLYINEDVDPLSGHLFLLPGDRWRVLRQKLTPTFTSGKMKMMFPVVEQCAHDLVEVLGASSGEVEFRDLLARYATDVIATCAFGLQTSCVRNPDDDFRYWGRRIITRTKAEDLINSFCVLFPSLANYFRIRTVPADIDSYFTNLVKTTMDHRDSHNVSRGDFLQLLMNLRNDQWMDEKPIEKLEDSGDIKLNIGQLTAQTVVFFLAGFETSSTTMSFALHELAQSQKIQSKLQQEIDETMGKSGGRLTYDNIMTMPYLDKVISETLRKYPPLPILNRVVTQEYHVPDTEWVLEKETAVIIPVMALQNDPQYFPQPERFDPERFSEEEKSKRHPFTYLPFGEGPRVCIGLRFGMMQTKIGIALLLSRYNIEPCSRTVKELKMDPRSFLINPVSGIWLRYTARSK